MLTVPKELKKRLGPAGLSDTNQKMIMPGSISVVISPSTTTITDVEATHLKVLMTSQRRHHQ